MAGDDIPEAPGRVEAVEHQVEGGARANLDGLGGDAQVEGDAVATGGAVQGQHRQVWSIQRQAQGKAGIIHLHAGIRI